MERATMSAATRANARLLSAGRKTIDEVTPESTRVDTYVYAIGTYEYQLQDVDIRYIEAVKKELGIVE